MITGSAMTELFGGISRLQRALDYHLERHNVVASNIANVDTPGFRARELLRETGEGASAHQIRRTQEGHLGPGERTARMDLVEDTTTPPGNDGNAVSLDREMAKLAANDLRFDGASKIVARQLAMLRYAANDGRG